MAVSIRPLHDRVLVKRFEEQEQMRGGIIIPDTAKEKPQEAEVVAVGPGKVQDDGSRAPMDVAKGDRILIGTSIIKVVTSDGTAANVIDAQAQMNAAAASARPAAAGSTMTGSIAEVALPDLLQLFSASKKTGVLQISTATDVGSIYLDDGKVRFAVVNGDESVPPEKAFYRILVWDAGTFDLLPEADREFPTEIQSSIEGLLMEGMRQLDEIRRLGDSLPPLQSKIAVATPLEKPLRDATPEELDVIQLALNHETLVDMMNFSGKPDPEVAELVVALLEKDYLKRA